MHPVQYVRYLMMQDNTCRRPWQGHDEAVGIDLQDVCEDQASGSELVECDRVYFERLLVGCEGVASGHPEADRWKRWCGSGNTGACCVLPLLLAMR